MNNYVPCTQQSRVPQVMINDMKQNFVCPESCQGAERFSLLWSIVEEGRFIQSWQNRKAGMCHGKKASGKWEASKPWYSRPMGLERCCGKIWLHWTIHKLQLEPSTLTALSEISARPGLVTNSISFSLACSNLGPFKIKDVSLDTIKVCFYWCGASTLNEHSEKTKKGEVAGRTKENSVLSK